MNRKSCLKVTPTDIRGKRGRVGYRHPVPSGPLGKASMSLINKSECRKLLLGLAERRWPGKFTRVSADVFRVVEADLRGEIQEFVNGHPTIGKTLMVGAGQLAARDNEKVSI